MKTYHLLLLVIICILVGIHPFGTGGGGVAFGQNCIKTYTLDADFDQGTLLNVNHDTPNNDQLQLNKTATPFPFVNIAVSARGTIVRIDVNTGAVLGEYWTSPLWMYRNPSRTTVDKYGNVWVANRAESGISPPGDVPRGSITRVGLVIGGIRCDEDGNPDPNGQYLKPPFSYSTVSDRDGDGLIKTSYGLGNILPWPNTGGADSHGGVSTAEDECIINYTRVNSTGTRTLAIDVNNDVWVGGIYAMVPYFNHEKVSGVTGLPIPGTQFNLGCGGYGGLIDGNGVLWSASIEAGLLRYDPSTNTGECLTDRGNYGLGIDPITGNIWHSEYGMSLKVHEIHPNGNLLNSYLQGFSAQGVCVDGNSHVWVAQERGSRVAHFAPDPSNPVNHIFVGDVTGFNGTTGVAVDANGKIWASEMYGNSASRIDPNAGDVGGGDYKIGVIDMTVSLGDTAYPYNYRGLPKTNFKV
ncbi:MAG: hypothetical protein QME52_12415 [Bacteroidota bacterium]|nr:hypothetical protein [Bacteroidota bacterium]